MKPFLPALLLFVLIVASAPAIGHVRDYIFETFPQGSVPFLAGGFMVAAAAFFVYALVRIRHHRWLRYGALAAVLALLWLQTAGLSTGFAKVDAAEKIHVLEYGALAFLLYRALLGRQAGAGDPSLPALTFLGATLAGTADEWVQFLAPLRVGEIRDVAMNATAGLSGLLFALALVPPARWSWRLDAARRRHVARAAAGVVLALGLFFYEAHLGYEVSDPEIGRFRSWYTAAELGELSAERRLEWQKHPPTGLETWGVEDFYLYEAAWHAGHRNSSFESGNFTLAWLANRVLEKYYGPFLDLESFRGSGPNRYSPERRRELEKKKGSHDPRTYLSPVQADRIYPWSKPLWLTLLGVLVLALWTSPRLLPEPPKLRQEYTQTHEDAACILSPRLADREQIRDFVIDEEEVENEPGG